jgi:hypothetical protein
MTKTAVKLRPDQTIENIIVVESYLPTDYIFVDFPVYLDATLEYCQSLYLAPNPDYVTFWDGLLVSAVYASIRTQSMASLPMNTLATEFIALIGDAKADRPNEVAIQASMDAILSTGTFTQADVDELTAILAAASLDTIYILGAPA